MKRHFLAQIDVIVAFLVLGSAFLLETRGLRQSCTLPALMEGKVCHCRNVKISKIACHVFFDIDVVKPRLDTLILHKDINSPGSLPEPSSFMAEFTNIYHVEHRSIHSSKEHYLSNNITTHQDPYSLCHSPKSYCEYRTLEHYKIIIPFVSHPRHPYTPDAHPCNSLISPSPLTVGSSATYPPVF